MSSPYPSVSAFSNVKHVRLEGATVNVAGRDINCSHLFFQCPSHDSPKYSPDTTYHHHPGSVHNHFPGAQNVNNGTNYGTCLIATGIPFL